MNPRPSLVVLAVLALLAFVVTRAHADELKPRAQAPRFEEAHLFALFVKCRDTRGNRTAQIACEREYFSYAALMPTKGKTHGR